MPMHAGEMGLNAGMQAGMPPELASLVGGGVGGGDVAEPQDAEDYVQAMLDMIASWRQAESDPEDLLVLEKISTLLQQISTGRAKEASDAMQGKLSPRILAQSYGG